jgi:hypothetical protein
MVWKKIIFFQSWLIKIIYNDEGFVKGEVFYENHVVVLFMCLQHLDFWDGRWNWNKISLFKHTCYFCAFMMTFVVLVL